MCVWPALVLMLKIFDHPVTKPFCLANFLAKKIEHLLVDDMCMKNPVKSSPLALSTSNQITHNDIYQIL
jgi:hypothetical protein